MQPDAVTRFALTHRSSAGPRELAPVEQGLPPSLDAQRVYAALRWPTVNVKGFREDCAPFVGRGARAASGVALGRPGPAARLRAHLATSPCDDSCPGWFVDGELAVLTRCDECVTNAARHVSDPRVRRRAGLAADMAVYDPTILLLPEAVLATCVEATHDLTGSARRRALRRGTRRDRSADEAERATGLLTTAILRSVASWRGWELDWQCPCEAGIGAMGDVDCPRVCAACGNVFVDQLAPLVGLFLGRCVEHEDCRADRSLGRACWLRQGEVWAHLTDPRSVT